MKTLKFITSLGIAAGTGLLIGVLTAPMKGKHTRSKILSEMDDTKEALDHAARKKLDEAKNMIKSAAEKQQNNGKEAIIKMKEKVSF